MPFEVVTGAFGYIGRYITARLLAQGRSVKTLTGHRDRPNPFGDRIEIASFSFNRADELVRSLEGCDTLYNTYWIRFAHGAMDFERAVANSRTLVEAARQAGVRKLVHISITNPSEDSPLPYFRGKAQVERCIVESGLYGLVKLLAKTVGSRAMILHVPPQAALLAARAIGLLVGDVVLTPDEVKGLTANLLISDQPPRGRKHLTQWLTENATQVGAIYSSEIARHYR